MISEYDDPDRVRIIAQHPEFGSYFHDFYVDSDVPDEMMINLAKEFNKLMEEAIEYKRGLQNDN